MDAIGSGLKVAMKDPSRKVFSSFISMRQAEIIREIREAYQLLASKSEISKITSLRTI